MSDTSSRVSRIRKIAWACAVLVLAITSLTAFIRQSRSGLGCEPWPQCYAQRAALPGAALAPLDSGAVLAARIGHRVAASVVLLLVIALLLMSLAREPMLWRQGRIVLAMLGAALFLAVVGRMGGESRLPVVTLGNLLGGYALLALSWRLVQATGARAAPLAAAQRLRPWLLAALALLVLQLAFGGLVSAQHATHQCASLDLCRLHRAAAFVVTAALLPLGWLAWRAGLRLGAAVAVLVVAQAVLGLLLAASAAPAALALAVVHNVLAALLLAALLALVPPR